MKAPRWSSLVVFLISCLSAYSARAAEDKSQYSVFNPTPRELMRELSTDRPDKTESPYTVDAGHFQIESDLVIFSQDKFSEGGVESTSRSLAAMVSNLKVGLTNSTDLQIIVSPHVREELRTPGSPTERENGFGDTLVRLKYNLFGNDGGDIAMGLMPFVKVPTASGDLGNDKLEGGLIVPIALALPSDWSMGLMAQVNRSKNEADDDFHSEFISTVTIGHDIVGDLAGYVEFFSQSSDEADAQWVATADFGLTYGLSPDIQLDAGANLGMTRAADDINPFLGFSARY